MFNLKNFILPIDELKDDSFTQHNVSVSMLRLDTIHPVISGNKIFKLYYFLEDAKKSTHKTIITFGGAYSNHLAATAFACKESGLKSIGIVRGERPETLSHTLLFCLEHGMELKFINRSLYKTINSGTFLKELIDNYGEHILIPEGGFSKTGKKGAALITKFYNENNFTHVCCAVGTATTIAGIIENTKNETTIIGFSVLKNLQDFNERLASLHVSSLKKYCMINDYHFGGYAKKNKSLVQFMNTFYDSNKIPLDFVYTGKLMFGIYDLIQKDYFEKNSKILCLHTGGLQGNKSLPESLLNF